MTNLMQKEDADRTNDVRGAMKSAAERVTRDQSKTKELQQVGKMILDYCGDKRGLDQAANLKTLVNVKLQDHTNLTNLDASIRDAGWAVIRNYIERAKPDYDKPPTMAAVNEWEQDKEITALLRNSLSIGADERGLRRVRDAIKRMEGN